MQGTTPSNRRPLLRQLLVFAAIFLLGGWAGWYFFKPKHSADEDSAVLLEKIRTVCKLVTVEGDFSEIYSYDDYKGYFTFFWDKKMLLRVQARVSAGYDLEKMKLEADPKSHVIRMTGLPEPEILSIDHKVDYYDISEGVFTGFTPQDYTTINERAKEKIREEALRSNLLPSAKTQGQQVLAAVKAMVESAGWTLEVEGSSTPVAPLK